MVGWGKPRSSWGQRMAKAFALRGPLRFMGLCSTNLDLSFTLLRVLRKNVVNGVRRTALGDRLGDTVLVLLPRTTPLQLLKHKRKYFFHTMIKMSIN